MSKLVLKAYNREMEVSELRQIARGYIVNVNRQKFVAGGYPFDIWTNNILPLISNKNYTTAIVVNDIGFEATGGLLELGFTHIIEVGTESFIVNRLHTLKNIVYKYDEHTTIDVHSIEEIKDLKKVDLIISNPPYAIGNEVTKSIIDNVDFDQFVNLMPISDYKKNNLYKNIAQVCGGVVWQGDADVRPYVCLLSKNKDETKSWDDIQLVTYDQRWIKYYKEQLRREASWVYKNWSSEEEITKMAHDRKTFLLTIRTGVDGVHKTQECLDYQWNINNKFSLEANDKYCFPQDRRSNLYGGCFSIFNSEVERNNIIQYWYSSTIMSQLVKGLNKQSFVNTMLFLPKVDWTRPWTDEEILRDYGYTEEEIQGILDVT